MPLPTSEQKLKQKIVSRFHKALYNYCLIENNDRLLVGLSGGKDSLCLLELLAERCKIRKPSFCIEALHVRMANIGYETDVDYLKEFAERHGVNFHVITTSFDDSTDLRKSPCFLCSWNRRKKLFTMAQELGCNKIALGHHMDDIINTAMLNLYFQGSFSTMPVKLKMRKMPLTIIRPLALETEMDLQKYAKQRGYARQLKVCPYNDCSKRTVVKKLFEEIATTHPEARYSVWHALENSGKLVEE